MPSRFYSHTGTYFTTVHSHNIKTYTHIQTVTTLKGVTFYAVQQLKNKCNTCKCT